MTNAFEEEVFRELEVELRGGLVSIVPNSGRYFSMLEDHFPISGSKIDWTKVPGAVHRHTNKKSSWAGEYLDFLDYVARFNVLDGRVIYMTDNAMEAALVLTVNMLKLKANILFSTPQHVYVVAEDFAWCVAFTMEGDMNFGHAPAVKTKMRL